MSKLVNAYSSTFSQLFGNKYYVIPKFQRAFAWRKEHVDDFWEDLTDIIRDKQQTLFLAAYHFFGSIVLQIDKRKNKSLVFDGQQRLTVVVALISIIRFEIIKLRDKLPNIEGRNSIDVLVKKLKKYLYDKEDRPYLQLTPLNNRYFTRCLLDSYEQVEEKKYKSEDFLQKYVFQNLTNKIKEAIDQLESIDKKLEYLEVILETILTRIYFVVIYTDKHFSAATLFETLNFRGASLNVQDLFKSLIYSKAEEQRCLGDIEEIWESNIEKIDKNNIRLEDFLKHFWISQNGKLIEGLLHKILKRDLENRKNIKVLNYLKDISKSLDVYIDILKPKGKKRWKDNKDIENNLDVIRLLHARESHPLLLKVFTLYKMNDNEKQELNKAIRRLLCLIKNAAFRILVCKKTKGRDLEKIYAETCISLENNPIEAINECARQIRQLAPDDRTLEQDFSSYVSSSHNLSKYILYELEKNSVGRAEPISLDSVSVEHIMPKNLGHGWGRVSRYHKEYLNRIGNLTLISKSFNKTNASFIRKRNKYYKNSNVLLTQALIRHSSWRKKEINERQKELASKAIEVWPIIH